MKTCGCAGIKVEYMFGSVKCFNRHLLLEIYSAHTCIYVQSNKIYMCYVTYNVHTHTLYTGKTLHVSVILNVHEDVCVLLDACQCASNCCQEKQRVIDQLMTQLQQLPVARPPRRGTATRAWLISGLL